MHCRFCNHPIVDVPADGLCPKCQLKLEVPTGPVCACGTPNKVGARFCRACGKPLQAVPAEPKEEHSRPTQPTSQPAPISFAPVAPAMEKASHPPEPTAPKPNVQSPSSLPGGAQASPSNSKFPAPSIDVSPRRSLAPWVWPVIGLSVLGLVIVVAVVAKPSSTPVPVVAPPTAPLSNSQHGVTPIAPQGEWFLKGGMVTGGFVSAEAQQDWPRWMQALVSGAAGVLPQELEQASLMRIPDESLPLAVQRLEAARVFTPEILKQAAAIGYTANTGAWAKARASYLKAYLSGHSLPQDDPLTCSRVLNQLAAAKEYALVRRLLREGPWPDDASQRSICLGLLDLEEGVVKATPDFVQNAQKSAAERFFALQKLTGSASHSDLIAGFQNTELFDNVVHLAVTKAWIAPSDPLVDEAVQQQKAQDRSDPWFLVRNAERVSDLLWLRATDALSRDQQEEAVRSANSLLERYPDSYYSGHAIFLLGAQDAGRKARLQVPTDVTVYNGDRFSGNAADVPWPAAFESWASKGRFDLILANADLQSQEAEFLRAAALSGQIDLAARLLTVERRCNVENLSLLYPCAIAPTVAKLLEEEGLKDQVEPAFVLSVIKCESLFQPSASSSADAFGMMQLLNPTFARMMGRNADIRDPLTNLRAGIRYFKQIIKTADLQSVPKPVRYAYLLAGYHAGEGRAKTWKISTEAKLNLDVTPSSMLIRIEGIPIQSTRQYLTRVLGDYEVYTRLLGPKG